MKFIDNILTSDQVQQFKDYWKNNQNEKYVNYEIDGEIQDYRLLIDRNSPEWQIILDVINKDFKQPKVYWAAYQRQYFAPTMHVDDFETGTELNTYTYIISLDTVPEFKTIAWKETCPSNDEIMPLYLKQWYDETLVGDVSRKKQTTSETEDVDHTFCHHGHYFCDWLELDNTFTYVAGNGCLFNARQLHCTSNWRKYLQFNSRDLLQLHVSTPETI